MIRMIASAGVLLFLTACICNGQQQAISTDVYVKGWTVGNEIREQTLNFDLNASKKERSQIVRDYGVGYYKVILTHHYPMKGEYGKAYWVVELKDVLSQDKKREKLGNDLISPSWMRGGDSFGPEDHIGVLFPKETPSNLIEKLLGPHYHPISSRRVIKVYDFFVIIKVNNYKMNDKNPKEIDSMNVTIEFKNHYQFGDECK